MIDPEIGFTSDVIRDPSRFVGRTGLIRNCITALNSRLGLIAVYGKRGVGKSSLLRQIQQMALGDYQLAKGAGVGVRKSTFGNFTIACNPCWTQVIAPSG